LKVDGVLIQNAIDHAVLWLRLVLCHLLQHRDESGKISIVLYNLSMHWIKPSEWQWLELCWIQIFGEIFVECIASLRQFVEQPLGLKYSATSRVVLEW